MFSLVKKNLPRHNTTQKVTYARTNRRRNARYQTGSTISTLLHDRINPKDCQVLFLGDTGFLQFFRVVSRDYGKPRIITVQNFGWTKRGEVFGSVWRPFSKLTRLQSIWRRWWIWSQPFSRWKPFWNFPWLLPLSFSRENGMPIWGFSPEICQLTT